MGSGSPLSIIIIAIVPKKMTNNFYEKKDVKLIVNKGGQYKNTNIYRATLPSKWIMDMGLGEDDRDLVLIFDEVNKEIIVRKR